MLLERLSVFAGGWALGSAEGVCAGDGIKKPEVLNLLSSLVEKSLVEKIAVPQTVDPRYGMHETIREYARDHLSKEGRPRWAKKHREHFLELAEDAEPHLRGGLEQTAWLRRLGVEHGNLRAAFATCMEEDGGVPAGLRLAGALGLYWEMCGHWSEGRKISADLLARGEDGGKTAARARVLRRAGGLALDQSDYGEARRLLEESLAISRELNDQRGMARSLVVLGNVTRSEGDHAAAKALYEEGLALARELGYKQLIAACLNNLANMERDRDAMRQLYLESLELDRELKDRAGEATVLGNLGWLAFNVGDYAEAQTMIEDGLAAYRELGNPRGVAWTLLLGAGVAIDLGDLERAGALAEEGLLLTREVGSRDWESYAISILGRVARLQGDLEGARALLEEKLETAKEIGRTAEANAFLGLGLVCLEAGEHERARALLADSLPLQQEYGTRRNVAAGLEGLGTLAVVNGTHARAARLFGAADALREEESCPVPPVDKPKLDKWISSTRRELGEEPFEDHWNSGRAMTREEAIEYARGEGDDIAPAQRGAGQAG
jgi:tetratricopeptide (TPR) repeat protein